MPSPYRIGHVADEEPVLHESEFAEERSDMQITVLAFKVRLPPFREGGPIIHQTGDEDRFRERI